MREYIKPTTEIIATTTEKFMGVSGTNNEPGGGDGFTNTTTFEQDVVYKTPALWDEGE